MQTNSYAFRKEKKVYALKGIDLALKPNEILGVVGRNGAGKTTLLRILADLLKPDSGTVRMCGHLLSQDGIKVRKKIGYVSSDDRNFFWRLTGRQNLEFFGRLYGLSARQVFLRSTPMLEELDIDHKIDQFFRDYSAGMRKKTAVIRAMLHRPSLLLFDEATNSLDPESARAVKNLVRQYVANRRDRAALWSTHRREEIDQICDRVIRIEQGQSGHYATLDGFYDKTSLRSDYLLRVGNLNGAYQMFRDKFGPRIKVVASQKDDVSEFVFNNISDDDFGHIVTMAIRDYGAYVVFAGSYEKKQ